MPIIKLPNGSLRDEIREPIFDVYTMPDSPNVLYRDSDSIFIEKKKPEIKD